VAALSELFKKWACQYQIAHDHNAFCLRDHEEVGEDDQGVIAGVMGASSDMDLFSDSSVGHTDHASLGQPPKRARSIHAISYHCTPFLSTISGSHHCTSLSGKHIAAMTDEKGQAVPLHDVSHLGLADGDLAKLIPLPANYTELYNTIKEDSGAASMEEPAICLVCGAVLASGPKVQRRVARRVEEGDCTIHARSCGSGSGIFLLVKRSNVLLMSGSRAAFYPVGD